MAQFPTVWTVVDQIDNSVNPKTQKGKPQKKIRTDKNQWVIVTGDGAEQIVVGLKIEISEPKPYGKNNTLYATLQSIETFNSMPPSFKPELSGAGPGEQALADARSVVNGAKPSSNGKIPWLEFQLAFKAAHALALDCEPDLTEEAESETALGEAHNTLLVRVDRSQARAALVNTFVIAFSNGRIEAPEVPDGGDDESVPF